MAGYPVSGSCQQVDLCMNLLPGNKDPVCFISPDQAGIAEQGDVGVDIFIITREHFAQNANAGRAGSAQSRQQRQPPIGENAQQVRSSMLESYITLYAIKQDRAKMWC